MALKKENTDKAKKIAQLNMKLKTWGSRFLGNVLQMIKDSPFQVFWWSPEGKGQGDREAEEGAGREDQVLGEHAEQQEQSDHVRKVQHLDWISI